MYYVYEATHKCSSYLHSGPRADVSGKGPFQLHLRVQVYPLDYHSLGHPASRFLLTLQLRRDLLENR